MFEYASPEELMSVPTPDLYADPSDRMRLLEELRRDGSACDRRDEHGERVKLSKSLAAGQEDGRPIGTNLVFSHGICAPCAEALYGIVMTR